MAASDQSIRLDPQNPWPGLPPYNESGSGFFFGRELEADELLRLVQLSPLTALYGKSGLGKSSLLQAALFPRLRVEHFLPIYIVLDIAEGTGDSALDQVARKLVKELGEQGAEFPPFEPGEDLWHYLHRSDLELWSKDNYVLMPVLVFDQFEEVFSRNSADPARTREVLFELADLIENRIPARFSSDRQAATRLDFRARRYRIILSFREDFLPDLRNWERNVPSLLKNWLQLQPLSREQAIMAVRQAGDKILAPGADKSIVDFVSNLDDASGQDDSSVEPVLLSLCSYQLNRRRQRDKAEFIDADMVRELGQDILQDFYAEALKDMPREVSEFIEDKLIQGDRFRGSYPWEQALEEGCITKEQLGELIDRHRLLRTDWQRNALRIELIHDRLVSVVRQARDKRLAEEQLLEEERRRQEVEARAESERKRADAEARAKVAAEKQVQAECKRADAEAQAKAIAEDAAARLKLQRKLLWMALLILVSFIVWGIRQTQQAITFGGIAQTQARLAKSMQLAFRAQAILDGSQSGSDIQAYLQILAAKGLADSAHHAIEEVDAVLFAAQRNIRSLFRISETEAAITAIALDLQGKIIASSCTDGSIRLWGAETGKVIGKMHSDSSITSLAFSPDGTKLVTGGYDKTLRIWDVAPGRMLSGAPLVGHEKAITGVAFSPDGKVIASSSGDRTLRLWKVDTGQSAGDPLKGHGAGVTSVAFSPDGKRLVSGSSDKSVQLWDLATRKMLGKPMLGHTATVTSVAFSPDGTRIVSGGEDQALRLWDAKTGLQVEGSPLLGHEDVVTSVAFSRDGTLIASIGQDRTVRLWNAANGRPARAPWRGHMGLVSGVAFDPKGQWVVSGGYDKTLRLWDIGNQLVGRGHSGTVAAVAYSPDGKRLVTGSYDKTLKIWEAHTGQPVGQPLIGHKAGISSVAFSPDGAWIVSGSYDKTLMQWDARTGRVLGEPLRGHSAGVSSVAYSPNGNYIASAGDDGTIRLWDVKPSPKILFIISAGGDIVTDIAFSPDGTKIVSASNDKSVRVWDVSTGNPVYAPLMGHQDFVTSVAFSPDGRHIVSASRDLTLRLWDTETGRPYLEPLRGHTDWVSSVSFSRDDKIVSASRDRTLRVWDAKTGKSIGFPLTGHGKGVWSVAFSPDDKWIASGSQDQTLQLWPMDTKVSIEALCNKIGRNMSHLEWNATVSPKFNYFEPCPGLPIPNDSN